MRLPDKTFQVVLQCDQSPHRLSLVSSQRWRDRSMLERSLLGRPFHPPPVQDTQTLVTQIFQHPKHPPFIAPIVEWIGVDHDVAVLTHPEPTQNPLNLAEIGVEQSLRHGIGITVLMPCRMHRSWDMSAEFVCRLAANIDNDKIRTA